MDFFSEPLSRILISNKLCSQRSAKNFIKNNDVLVNGILTKDASLLVNQTEDVVTVNKKILPQFQHKIIMMNKPCGVVCSTVSDSHLTVYDLVKKNFNDKELYRFSCVGRLDCDTSGLLLLTTNGSLVKALTDPANHVEKKYYVKLEKSVIDQKSYTDRISQGIEIPPEKKSSGFISRGAELQWISDNEVYITITEGKFHEVRRIFSALGNFVIELKRLSMGDFMLDENLKEGDFKVLG